MAHRQQRRDPPVGYDERMKPRQFSIRQLMVFVLYWAITAGWFSSEILGLDVQAKIGSWLFVTYLWIVLGTNLVLGRIRPRFKLPTGIP